MESSCPLEGRTCSGDACCEFGSIFPQVVLFCSAGVPLAGMSAYFLVVLRREARSARELTDSESTIQVGAHIAKIVRQASHDKNGRLRHRYETWHTFDCRTDDGSSLRVAAAKRTLPTEAFEVMVRNGLHRDRAPPRKQLRDGEEELTWTDLPTWTVVCLSRDPRVHAFTAAPTGSPPLMERRDGFRRCLSRLFWFVGISGLAMGAGFPAYELTLFDGVYPGASAMLWLPIALTLLTPPAAACLAASGAVPQVTSRRIESRDLKTRAAQPTSIVGHGPSGALLQPLLRHKEPSEATSASTSATAVAGPDAPTTVPAVTTAAQTLPPLSEEDALDELRARFPGKSTAELKAKLQARMSGAGSLRELV